VLSLDSLATYIHAVHPDVDDVVDRGTIDIVHDQHIFLEESRLSAAIGLPDDIGLSVVVPLRAFSTTIRYLDTMGNVVQLVHPGIHHRNETLVGVGDPLVLGSIGAGRSGWWFTARAGASLPVGRTQPNPFVLGDEGLPHEHFQMGTGTIDPVIDLEVSRAWTRWRAGAYALAQLAFYEDSYGYQVGDRYAGGVDVVRTIGRRWRVDGGAFVDKQLADRWAQTPDPTEGNLGRFDLMLTGGASWIAARDLSVDLGVKVPVVTHVVGGQLDMPAIVDVGVTWSFGGPPPPRAVHPDATGLDVADVAVPEPVLGKTTIVDYWATWCAPCKLLEPRLVELARAHADRVALRRIDVSDRDDFTEHLPRVAVYDPSGAKVLERSAEGDVPGLLDAVRVAIGEAPTEAVPTTDVHVRVTDLGFEPANVVVPAGVPVTITFVRESQTTCATNVVLTVDGQRIARELPLHQPVTITTTFAAPGVVAYACGMDMLHGTITVKGSPP
jgi:thiol-disulfide isomerase/thioredoxin